MGKITVKIINDKEGGWSLETKINKFLETLESATDQLIDIKIGRYSLGDSAMIIYKDVPS